MTAWSDEPDYAESSYFTGETANTTYGPMTVYPSRRSSRPSP